MLTVLMHILQLKQDSLDWKGLTVTEMEARILPRLRSGSIILFHSGAEKTADALSALLEEIRAAGYVFSTVGDMIYKENYTVNHEGRQILKEAERRLIFIKACQRVQETAPSIYIKKLRG